MLEIRLKAMCFIWRYNFYCTHRIRLFARFSWSEARTHDKTATLDLHSITEYFIGCKVLHQGKRQMKRQIKDKLKDKGLTARLRSIKKLQELFLNTLREEKNINSTSLHYSTCIYSSKLYIVITNYWYYMAFWQWSYKVSLGETFEPCTLCR